VSLLLCGFAIPEVAALVSAAVLSPEAALRVKVWTGGVRAFSLRYAGRAVGVLICLIPVVNLGWHEAMLGFHQPPPRLHAALSCFAVYLAVMCDGYFLLSVWRDPGFVALESGSPPDHLTSRRFSGDFSTLAPRVAAVATSTGGDGGVLGMRYCDVCRGVKPPGAHHCSVCRRCVHGMDHHCPFTANCVGRNNRHLFLWAGFFGCVGCFYAMVVSAGPFMACVWYASSALPAPTVAACARLQHEGLLFVVAAIGFVSGLCFALWHLWNAAEGVTTVSRYKKVFRREQAGPGALSLHPGVEWHEMPRNVWRAFALDRIPLWHVLALYPVARGGGLATVGDACSDKVRQ
jgi:hypothetical protein